MRFSRFRWPVLALALAGLVALGATALLSTSSFVPPVAVHPSEAPFFVQPERMAVKRVRMEAGPVDLVFIGDSITQNYETYPSVWNEFYGHRNDVNLGYGMDTTGATLWRFEHGELDGISPKVAVVLIGTNDTNLGRDAGGTIAGVEAVVAAIRARLPQTKVLLLGILPSAKTPRKSAADTEINKALAVRLSREPNVTFLDIGSIFMKDGALDRSLYVEQPPEGALHPNARGQAAMAAAIEPTLARLMERGP